MASSVKGSKGFKSKGERDPQQWSLDKAVKVDKWDGAAVKNALDDAVKQILLEKHGYVESHHLMDGRLIICTVSVGFALYALLWDYLHPFPQSRNVLICCVVSYFVMMLVLTLYTTFQERGCFLVALDKDKAGIDPDNVWRVSSQLKRYDDMYHLFMTYKDGTTNQSHTSSMTKSVANFFDENGHLCADIYEPLIDQLHADLSAEKKKK